MLATARYSTGWPARFHVVAPWLVNVEMDGGRRRYSIGGVDVTGDMLHIPYQIRADEAHGHGPLEAGAGRVVAARLLARYATNLVAGGGLPTGVLTHPGRVDRRAVRRAAGAVGDRRGMSSMGLPAVLSGGVTFEADAFVAEQIWRWSICRGGTSHASPCCWGCRRSSSACPSAATR